MDDVMEDVVTYHIPEEPNVNPGSHSKFAAYYKPKFSTFDHEERRAALLLAQKQKRDAILQSKRHLPEAELEEEDREEGTQDIEEMAIETPPQVMALVQRTPKRFRTFLSADELKDHAAYAEWLTDSPWFDRNDWLFVFCPQGFRCLIIAADGKTEVFSTSGTSMKTFASLLPGGNLATKNTTTILDCIVSLETQIFHVLDCLCWNRLSLLDVETAARVSIVKTQFRAEPGLAEASLHNPYRFVPLPFFPVVELGDRIHGPLPFQEKLDGVQFFHKNTVYSQGYTPLVGWLKAHMLPRMLKIYKPDDLLKGGEVLLWQPKTFPQFGTRPMLMPAEEPQDADVMEIVELPADADSGDLPVITSVDSY